MRISSLSSPGRRVRCAAALSELEQTSSAKSCTVVRGGKPLRLHLVEPHRDSRVCQRPRGLAAGEPRADDRDRRHSSSASSARLPFHRPRVVAALLEAVDQRAAPRLLEAGSRRIWDRSPSSGLSHVMNLHSGIVLAAVVALAVLRLFGEHLAAAHGAEPARLLDDLLGVAGTRGSPGRPGICRTARS